KPETIDVPRLLETLVANARRAAGATHYWTFAIDPGLTLFGRAGEIESVFANLLANAVRYTPDAGRIDLPWWRDAAGAHLALTERFYRVDAGRQACAGGTGLGLAIVKHGLEHHHGELAITSTPGLGSTFTCHFPATRALRRQAA